MKMKLSLFIVSLVILSGFQSPKTNNYPIKKGMIKMAILYPNGEGKTFDMDYYVNKHMTMAKALMGDKVKIIAIDKGLSGGAADSPAPFLAMGYFYFDTMTDFKDGMAIARPKLIADVPNFTNIQPVVVISEVQQ